uniref:Uncharacterized protein n=1 Tax=Myotis myotis TaxID=51298 RepID=A0A7J7S210_MYOMY|nr:hypothetical protein mMyoMyo1_010043 [Myotis myotis]
MSPSAYPTANPVRLMAESVRLWDRSGGAPTAQPQNEYFTYLTAYRSPTATRACAVPVLAVVMLSSETTWLAPWSCGGRDSTCPATSGQPFSGRTGTPELSGNFGCFILAFGNLFQEKDTMPYT